MTPSRVSVVLVEDSPTQLAHLVRVLERGAVKVAAEATTAAEGVAAVERHRPDVVVMDLDVPGSGQVAIERIMSDAPVPILVLSGTFTERSASPAVAALAAGAVEVLPKPSRWDAAAEEELRRLVRMVAGVRVVRRRAGDRWSEPPQSPAAASGLRPEVIGVVASTGGPSAVSEVLRPLRGAAPPILVVQHIHDSFVGAFAKWLATTSGLRVAVAVDGERIHPGGVYMAPGGCHLLLDGGGRLRLQNEPRTLHHPSGDLMLESLARHAGRAAVGVVLTGMGSDGARGLLAIHRAGGRTYAQDEASSTVFGMPRAAQIAGAVDQLQPPRRIGAAIASVLAR